MFAPIGGSGTSRPRARRAITFGWDGLRWSYWWFPDNTYDLKLWVNGNELKKVAFAMAIEAL